MNWKSIMHPIWGKLSHHRLGVMASLGAIVVGGVLWVAAAPAAYSPTHYVVKWADTGMCTVVRERPNDGRKYKIVWFTTLKRIASRKASELKETGKCGRTPLPPRQPQQS